MNRYRPNVDPKPCDVCRDCKACQRRHEVMDHDSGQCPACARDRVHAEMASTKSPPTPARRKLNITIDVSLDVPTDRAINAQVLADAIATEARREAQNRVRLVGGEVVGMVHGIVTTDEVSR